MLLAVLLLLGRWQQAVFGVVVDHGLGQNLIAVSAAGFPEMFVHECGHLIHVQVDVRDVPGIDREDGVRRAEKVEEQLLAFQCIGLILSRNLAFFLIGCHVFSPLYQII